MQSVVACSANIVLIAVVAAFAELLVPAGKMQKIANTVMSALVICCVITQFVNFKNDIFSYFNSTKNFEKSINKSNVVDYITDKTRDFSKENIKALVAGILADMGVSFQKIEVFMDITEDNCIVMVRCKIYIGECDDKLKNCIKSEVESKLNIKTEVVAK